MRPTALVVMVVALAACQSTSTVTTTVVTPSSNPSAMAVVACRLPVVINKPEGGYQDAFLDTRSGQVTIDPAVTNGLYYDSKLARWLPVNRYGVSPDDRQYAYGGGTQDFKPILHIVDIATGADHVYPLPPEIGIGLAGPTVLAYTMKSIYIGEPTEGGMRALWTFDLATHTTSFVNLTGVGLIDGDIAWRSTLDTTDKSAWSWQGVPPANQIERLDLAGGTHVVWLNSPGHLVDVIGLDANHDPVVRDFIDRQTIQLLVLSGPSQPQVFFKGSVNDWAADVTGTFADGHGVWLGTGTGVYLYSAAGALTKVTDQGATPAGDCQDQS